MVYSGDVGWSQGVSPVHHGRSGATDGEPVSAAENRCLDLQVRRQSGRVWPRQADAFCLLKLQAQNSPTCAAPKLQYARVPQENLVEAIERAAAALRVVHDESQSRELRSLITIRRVDDEPS